MGKSRFLTNHVKSRAMLVSVTINSILIAIPVAFVIATGMPTEETSRIISERKAITNIYVPSISGFKDGLNDMGYTGVLGFDIKVDLFESKTCAKDSF